jgi:ribosome-associated protein
LSAEELTSITALARALDAKKAENIVVLDLRNQSSYLSYFVIATALSKAHLKTLFDEVQKTVQELGLEQPRPQPPQFDSGWVTYDLGFFVIHLFDEEKRRFYNLEAVWKNATRLDVLRQKSSTNLTPRKGTSKSEVITKKNTQARPKKSSQKSASLAKKKTTINKKKMTKEKTMATAKKKPAKKAAKKPAKKKAAKKQ